MTLGSLSLFDIRGHSLNPAFRWHCEPTVWELDAVSGTLRVRPDSETDFWQRTHYGFCADNGHFLYVPVGGDFEVQVRVRLQPQHQYDQAGLMVRLSPDCWLKTSVEHEPDGCDHLGAVVTNAGWSDWSTQEVHELRELVLKVAVQAGDFKVHWQRTAEREWHQLRIGHLLARDGGAPVFVGIYSCSPKIGGFEALFDQFLLCQGPPQRGSALGDSAG